MKYLFCFLWLWLLVSCQSTGVDAELLENMIESQERAARVIEEQNDLVLRNLAETLWDDSKRRYLPIKTTIDSMRNLIDGKRKKLETLQAELDKAMKKSSPLPELGPFANELATLPDQLLTFTANLYEMHGDSFRLTSEEMKSRVLSLQKELPFGRELLYENNTASALSQRCWLSKSLADLASMEAVATSFLAELTGSRTLICFPLNIPRAHKIQTKQHNSERALVFIELQERMEQTKSIYLYANGKRLKTYAGVYAFYETESGELPSTIPLTGHVFNSLIGYTDELFPISPYLVEIE